MFFCRTSGKNRCDLVSEKTLTDSICFCEGKPRSRKLIMHLLQQRGVVRTLAGEEKYKPGCDGFHLNVT